MTIPDPIFRRPGAQPGNTNAFKHGFYSPRFHQVASGDLAKVKFTGVSDEIDMLRESIRRVVEMSEDIASLPEALSCLRVLSLASMSLSRLVRAQKLIADLEKDKSIGRAITESGAASDDSPTSEDPEKYDPTIQWAQCDPPEDSLPHYPIFDPSEYGKGG